MSLSRPISIRHLIAILLGAFLFTVPAYSANLDFVFDPNQPLQMSVFAGEFTEKAHSGYDYQLKCNSDYGQYYVKIRASGDLTSPGKTPIPIASLKWMCTYVNFYDGSSHASQGKLYVEPPAYTGLTNSDANVYLAATAEGTTFSDELQPQFKFALQTPGNQEPGIYSGQLICRIQAVTNPLAIIEKTINISVEVMPMFQLLIDRGTIDFESMMPGQEKENIPVEGIIVTTKTSNGNPWFLKISNNSPLTSGPYVIPNSNFVWYGWTDGVGGWRGTGTDTLSLNPQLAYASGAGEENNSPDGTANHFKFKLKVPAKQKPGKYISTVKFTLTE